MPRSQRHCRRGPRRAAGLGVEFLEPRHVLASGPFVGVRLVASGNESGPTPTIFEFRRSGATTAPLVVNAYLSGTATANVDFTGPSTLQPSGRFNATIPAGQSTVRVGLATRPDSVYDPMETISVVVGLAPGYVIQPAGDQAEAILGAEGVTGIVADEESRHTYGYRCVHETAFVAVAPDGSVVPLGGGESPGVDFDGPRNDLTVVQVVANQQDFAALRSDGSVVTWRKPVFGGSSSFQNGEFNSPAYNPAVVRIVASADVFAALRSDGTIIMWGDRVSLRGFTGLFTHLVSNGFAFAALRDNGEVVTWGSSDHGGDARWVQFKGPNGDLAVTKIIPGPAAFVAIRSDGSAVTWGYPFWEGAPGTSPIDLNGPGNDLTLASIVSNGSSFCALRSDGSVVAWGHEWYGGDASSVDFDGPQNNLTVIRVFPLGHGYAALRSDGSVVMWGQVSGALSSPSVDFNGPNDDLTVTRVVATGLPDLFAALRSDGSVIAWGQAIDSLYPPSRPFGINGDRGELAIRKLIAKSVPIAALRSDGRVVQFPDDYVPYPSLNFREPNNDVAVTGLFKSSSNGIAALRSDGTMLDASLGLPGTPFRAATITTDELIVTTRDMAPAGIMLSSSTVNEGMPIGTVVGRVMALDANPGDTFTYALVSGVGSEGNAAFRIRGDSLETAAIFNFEFKDSYSVRVRATDHTGRSVEKVVVIRISDVLEPLQVESVTMPEPRAYGRGDTLRFTLTLAQPGFVYGSAPTIDVMAGAGAKSATYVRGSGTNSLVFEYTIRASDSAPAVVLGSVIRMPHPSTMIRDVTGSPMLLTIPGGQAVGVSIDTTAPVLQSVVIPAVRVYRDGEIMRFAATFSDRVLVWGTPFLTFRLNGASVREAKYVSGSGTTTLFFEYRVRVAGVAPRILATVTGLRLGDGAITDFVGNAAEFDFRKVRRATVLMPARYPTAMWL